MMRIRADLALRNRFERVESFDSLGVVSWGYVRIFKLAELERYLLGDDQPIGGRAEKRGRTEP
jgi:hypothetical protein